MFTTCSAQPAAAQVNKIVRINKRINYLVPLFMLVSCPPYRFGANIVAERSQLAHCNSLLVLRNPTGFTLIVSWPLLAALGRIILVEWAPFYHPLHPNADARRHQPE